MMDQKSTDIEGVYILTPQIYEDERGYFTESYSKKTLENIGIYIDFVQDNTSYSLKKGTLRGLHFQDVPMAQTKLIRCTKGIILDVAVDLRKGSPTYLKWIGVELSDENNKQIFIPKGFAHGYLTLSDHVEVQYKVDEYYSIHHDISIRYDDPDISINWPNTKPILSEKDQNGILIKESNHKFFY